jgi:hypothetical protein
LTDPAPGAVLNGGNNARTSSLYGKHQIVFNEVPKEYRNLLAKFGSAVRARSGAENVVDLIVTRPGKEGESPNTAKAEVRSFKLPSFPDIPLVDETIHILAKQTWPDSINMFFSNL